MKVVKSMVKILYLLVYLLGLEGNLFAISQYTFRNIRFLKAVSITEECGLLTVEFAF